MPARSPVIAYNKIRIVNAMAYTCKAIEVLKTISTHINPDFS